MSQADIVSVTVSVKDAVPAGNSFSTVAVFSYHNKFTGWRTYTADAAGLAQLVTDGFTTSDRLYKIISALSSQNPKIDSVKTYPRAVTHPCTVDFTFTDVTPGKVHSFDISDGGAYTTIVRTNGGAETPTTLATAFAALITAVTPALSMTATATTKIVLAGTAGARVYLRSVSRGITVLDTTTDADIATDLAAGAALDNNWYGLIVDGTGKSCTTAAGAWAEANGKLFSALTSDSEVLTAVTTDVGSSIQTSGYNNTAVWYSGDMGGYLNAAIMSRQFSLQPGSSSWHMKKVAGAGTDNLTQAELVFARGKNVNTYVSDRGIAHTFDGKAGSGRFLDITHGVAWMVGRIQDDQLALDASQEKIDYTDDGIGLKAATLDSSLSAGVVARLITSAYKITIPKASAQSVTDRGNRLLQNLTFNAPLAGAIHKTVIVGTVQV